MSVVIPLFDAARWIAETISTVVQGIAPWRVAEVIVVDDGSADDGPSVARKELEGTGLEWRLLSGPQRGPSAARNIGMRATSGRYIQFLDADDLLLPGSLERRIVRMKESGADVVCSWWDRLIEKEDGRFERVAPARTRIRDWHRRSDVAVLRGFWAPPAAVLYSRRIVETIGPWDESLPVIQDARFLLDAARHGGSFVEMEEVGALYRVHRGPSVSRRDPVAFRNDIHRSAADLMETWTAANELDEDRKEALIEVFSGVARGSIRSAPDVFEDALRRLDRLRPGWRPTRPRALAWASRILGTRRAISVAETTARIRHLRSRGNSTGRP